MLDATLGHGGMIQKPRGLTGLPRVGKTELTPSKVAPRSPCPLRHGWQ
jgi:hypothetical protein